MSGRHVNTLPCEQLTWEPHIKMNVEPDGPAAATALLFIYSIGANNSLLACLS